MPSGMRSSAIVGANITHTAEESVIWRSLRAMAMERQKGLCFWCTRPMGPPGSGPLEVTLEHLKQRSEGGENTPENTAASCRDCNSTRPAAEHIIARQRGLSGNVRLIRAAMALANERWLEGVEARREEFYAQQSEQPPLPEEYIGAERESVTFWISRGAELFRAGDAQRIRDSLGFLSQYEFLTKDEASAGRGYGRLYSDTTEIRQPWMPPQEMMEWRMERCLLLRDIRTQLLEGDKAAIAVMDDVCGRNVWILDRFGGDFDRLAILKKALARLAENIEMTFVEAA